MAKNKANRSGVGPQGRAPFSRAPVVGAVKPTTPNRNPNSSGGPVRTGGGVGQNKHVKITPVGGSNQTRKTSPDAVSNAGRQVGNHSMTDGKTLQRPNVPLHQPMPTLGGRLGNDLNYEQGRTGDVGPGRGGRVVHATGSQSTYGAAENHPGNIAADRRISPPGSNQGKPLNRNPAPMSPPQGGGPGSFGFKVGGK